VHSEGLIFFRLGARGGKRGRKKRGRGEEEEERKAGCGKFCQIFDITKLKEKSLFMCT